jgi:type IV pilus assembly protein PilX
MKTLSVSAPSFPSRQRGVVLFIALIVLVAMTLAGIAMMRSVGTNVLIAGNIAFKQATTSVSDYGVEKAREWLLNTAAASPASLQNDDPANGYYSSYMYDPTAPTDLTKNFDPFRFTWANGTAKLAAPAVDPATTVYYVIHRMCKQANMSPDDPNQQCVTLESSSSGSTKNLLSGTDKGLDSKNVLFYRITTQVIGPKNTTSFVQSVMY